jgi:hypothetical protein
LALYLANRDNYFSILEEAGQQVAVRVLATTFPAIVFFIVLYSLAIFYRRRPALHMRFMSSTAFLFIDPALDRALTNYLDLRVSYESIIIVLSLVGIVTIVDSLRIKRISQFALVFVFLIMHLIFELLSNTPFWQAIGNGITKIF